MPDYLGKTHTVSHRRDSTVALRPSLTPTFFRAHIAFSLISLLAVFRLGTTFGSQRSFIASSELDEPFEWAKIQPSSKLRWFECDSFQCARLEVPLDYSYPNGEKAAIAIIKVASTFPSNSPEYRGPVLFNPGGPGGSGVEFIRGTGQLFQTLLGPEYDIIGFDPRGIGHTTPAVYAFKDVYESASWASKTPPLPNSTSDAMARSHAYWQIQGRLVQTHSEEPARHVSTSTVARDMLMITKAHGREKILYWGFSYGTVLGATFAAMFPDNIERLVIDGVVDANDYISTKWSTNLRDTDKGLQFFYEECSKAGPVCALSANSSALVKQRMEHIFDSVKANPVASFDGKDYGVIDYSLIKIALFQALYKPFGLLRIVTSALVALEHGDGGTALDLLKSFRTIQPACKVPVPSNMARTEAGNAVMCGEGDVVRDTVSDLTEHYNELSQTSVFADVWTSFTRAPCSGWKTRTQHRFAGPFIANTSYPLLMIGNIADPVTPIFGAHKMATGFNGSVVLTQNSPGHCSLSATSTCTTKYIRSYFRHGSLPAHGTICEVKDKLFPPDEADSLEFSTWDATDSERKLQQVTKSLSASFQQFRMPLFL